MNNLKKAFEILISHYKNGISPNHRGNNNNQNQEFEIRFGTNEDKIISKIDENPIQNSIVGSMPKKKGLENFNGKRDVASNVTKE